VKNHASDEKSNSKRFGEPLTVHLSLPHCNSLLVQSCPRVGSTSSRSYFWE